MSNSSPSAARLWLPSLAGFALVLGLLYFYPLPQMHPVALPAVLVGLGWLAFQYLASVGLIRRHAFLSHVTREGSRFRQLFWRASLLRFRLSIAALLTALLALLLTARLETYEWSVIGLSILSFMLLLGPVSRRCARQFVPRYRFALALRGTWWLNLALVATALAAYQVFWVEVPATHHASLAEVAELAFRAEAARAEIPQVGWLLGLNAAATEAIWHLMQVASPAAQGNRWLYILACGLVLAWNALKLGAVWLLLLGVLSIAHRSATARGGVEPALSEGYGASVLLLLLSGVLAGLLAAQLKPEGSWLPVPAAQLDPCAREQQRAARQARGELAVEQAEFLAGVDAIVAARVDEAYALAEQGVDRFLDWNFSLTGQYQQLYFLAASLTGPPSFAQQVGEKIDEHVLAGLAPALEALAGDMEAELAHSIAAVYRRHDAFLDGLLAEMQCVDQARPTIAFDQYMHKSLVGAGAGAGIIAARLGSRLGSKVVSRTAVKRALSATAARFSSKAATAGQAGSTGALCGPLAPACIPAIGVATWLAVDLLINAVDEALNREQMRAEMLAVLAQEKESLRQSLGAQYAAAASAVFGELEAYQQARFNVARAGQN